MENQQQTQQLLTIPADVLQAALNFLAEQPYNKTAGLITSIVNSAKPLNGASATPETV